MKLPYRIYIPTRGRTSSQLTLDRLPELLHKNVTLVCPHTEVDEIMANYPTVSVLAQPETVKTISKKRAWIAEFAGKQPEPFWFQMDDDLYMSVWNGSKHVTVKNDPAATEAFYTKTLPELIQKYECLGFGTKGFALPGGVRENYHLGFVFGFSKILASKLSWSRVKFYEDIDYTLQVLKLGVTNALTYDLVVDQKAAGAAGGISDERNAENARVALLKLIELHPGLVSEKPPSGQHPYSNTKVSWAAAAAQGKASKSKSLF